MTVPTEAWLSLREDLTNPAELMQARGEALSAVIAWMRKWKPQLRQLPDPAMAELADAVGTVVARHGATVAEGRSAIEACRAAGKGGTVAELAECMRERRSLSEGERATAPRRGRPDGSAWHDFLDRSGDL